MSGRPHLFLLQEPPPSRRQLPYQDNGHTWFLGYKCSDTEYVLSKGKDQKKPGRKSCSYYKLSWSLSVITPAQVGISSIKLSSRISSRISSFKFQFFTPFRYVGDLFIHSACHIAFTQNSLHNKKIPSHQKQRRPCNLWTLPNVIMLSEVWFSHYMSTFTHPSFSSFFRQAQSLRAPGPGCPNWSFFAFASSSSRGSGLITLKPKAKNNGMKDGDPCHCQ